MGSEELEATVDLLDPIPLPGVSPGHLGGLGWGDGVPQGGVVVDGGPMVALGPQAPCQSLRRAGPRRRGDLGV